MKYSTLKELRILENVTDSNVELIKSTLDSNLEKGLISEELHEKALEQLENLIEKAGGEGSRGGKIIGHTKSGKPVYLKNNSQFHADHYRKFNADDHEDAADLHSKSGNKKAVNAHKKMASYERKEESKEFGK